MRCLTQLNELDLNYMGRMNGFGLRPIYKKENTKKKLCVCIQSLRRDMWGTMQEVRRANQEGKVSLKRGIKTHLHNLQPSSSSSSSYFLFPCLAFPLCWWWLGDFLLVAVFFKQVSKVKLDKASSSLLFFILFIGLDVWRMQSRKSHGIF